MRLALFAALLIATAPLRASADVLGGGLPGLEQNAFAVEVTPLYPAPNSFATLSFRSDGADLSSMTLTVSVSGKQIYSGNAQSVRVPLGKAGVAVPITVTASGGGARYSKALTLRPQEVSLIAEPQGFFPPLLAGKAHPPLEGTVRVIAVANLKTATGKSLDPATLSYTWTIDDTEMMSASGIGRSSVVVASPLQYRSRFVSVVVASPDGTIVGGASFTFIGEEPLLRVYTQDPLLGIEFARAVSGVHAISGVESTLYAAPLSLPLSTTQNQALTWYLNGEVAQTGPLITLRPTGSGEGTASLSVVATGGDTLRASETLSVVFGSKKSSNFFGL